MIFWQIEALLENIDFTIKTPVKDMPDDAIDEILYGSDERIKIKSTLIHTSSDYFVTYEGIVKYIQMMQEKDARPLPRSGRNSLPRLMSVPNARARA